MKKTLAPLLLSAALGLLLTGCADDSTDEPTPTVTVTETVTATPSPSPSPESEEEPEFSSRGALIMKAGQSGVVTADDETVLKFTVKSIKVDPQCTAPGASPAKNGHFVVFDTEVEAFEGIDDVDMPGNFFNQAGFRVIDKNGDTRPESPLTNVAFTCLPESEMLNSGFGQGEKASGKVVFDVPVKSGVLINEFGTLKWEWEF